VAATSEGGCDILVERVLPYFQRTDSRFYSHFQTPTMAAGRGEAAVLEGDCFIYFAAPIFREYRQTGNPAVRIAGRTTMYRLIGPPAFEDGCRAAFYRFRDAARTT
jgi:hypothetical protein